MTRTLLPQSVGAALALSLPVGGCGSDIMQIDDLELELDKDSEMSVMRGSFRVTDPGDCEEDPVGCPFAPWTVQLYMNPIVSDAEALEAGIELAFHEAEVVDVRGSRVHFELLLGEPLEMGSHRVGLFVENERLDNSNHVFAVVAQP